jgi:exosome complex component RRP40
VIGVVTQRLGEGYRVDIGEAHQASLDALAFESATKRNKPNLKVSAMCVIVILSAHEIHQVGSLVYARVSLAHKDMEPELECFDAQTRKAEGHGELKGGFVVRCSLKMCRQSVFHSILDAILCAQLSAGSSTLNIFFCHSSVANST